MSSNNTLPISKFVTSVKNIQAGAIYSRDWAPLHSDQDWAINKGNLPNIIMNNYTLNGLVIKFFCLFHVLICNIEDHIFFDL